MQNKFDVIIIGGGATGMGVALEAASRGYTVALFEADDFGSGTSSKSTKLVHGGLRYLANFDFALVKEGLEERKYFLQNAPHLSYPIGYLVPFYSRWEQLQYFMGIKLYDFLAGGLKLKSSHRMSKAQILVDYPNIKPDGLLGGMIYYDGSFDDTRLLISLAKTIKNLGGKVFNYSKVIKLLKEDDLVNGVMVQDGVTGEYSSYYAKVVINATGTLSDKMIDLADTGKPSNLVLAAQGTHIVIAKEKFKINTTLVIPKTADGRLLFVLPWHDRLVIGTTDVQVNSPSLEPIATDAEIDFILDTLNSYSTSRITRADILSVFAGQRPLVRPNSSGASAKISRKHEIFNHDNLITIVGGKWTIYRRMGEDTINYIEKNKLLALKTKSISKKYPLVDALSASDHNDHRACYGLELTEIKKIAKSIDDKLIIAGLPYYQSEIIYIIQHEQVKTLIDIIARRTRMVYLDAKLCKLALPKIAELYQNYANDKLTNIDELIAKATQFVNNYIVKEQ